MLLRKDALCAKPQILRLTIHSVNVGVLSSNMGPTAPLAPASKGNSVFISYSQIGSVMASGWCSSPALSLLVTVVEAGKGEA